MVQIKERTIEIKQKIDKKKRDIYEARKNDVQGYSNEQILAQNKLESYEAINVGREYTIDVQKLQM